MNIPTYNEAIKPSTETPFIEKKNTISSWHNVNGSLKKPWNRIRQLRRTNTCTIIKKKKERNKKQMPAMQQRFFGLQRYFFDWQEFFQGKTGKFFPPEKCEKCEKHNVQKFNQSVRRIWKFQEFPLEYFTKVEIFER